MRLILQLEREYEIQDSSTYNVRNSRNALHFTLIINDFLINGCLIIFEQTYGCLIIFEHIKNEIRNQKGNQSKRRGCILEYDRRLG